MHTISSEPFKGHQYVRKDDIAKGCNSQYQGYLATEGGWRWCRVGGGGGYSLAAMFPLIVYSEGRPINEAHNGGLKKTQNQLAVRLKALLSSSGGTLHRDRERYAAPPLTFLSVNLKQFSWATAFK